MIVIAKRFNPFLPNVSFLYLLKKSENESFSDDSKLYRNGNLGEHGLSKLH